MNALTQLGLYWRDDDQVCAGEIQKLFGETPGAVITITQVAI